MKHTLILMILLLLSLTACRPDEQIAGGEEFSERDSLSIKLVDSLNQAVLSHFSDPSFEFKDSIFEWSKKSIGLAEDLKYEYGQAVGLYVLGRYYISIAIDPAQATNQLLSSLEIFTRLGDKEYVSRCYMQLGLINYMIEFYEEAVRNLELAVEANENHTAKYLLALSYTKIGDFPHALDYFNRSIEYYETMAETKYLSQCYQYMGQLYLEMNQTDSSFIALRKAKQFMGPDTDEMDMIRWYAFISKAFLETSQIDSAIYYGEKSFRLETQKVDVLKDEISLIEATHTLSQAYRQKRMYDKAYFFLEKHHEAKTILTEGSSNQKVTNMVNMFEFEQKMDQQKMEQEKEQELARQQIANGKQLRNFLIAGAVLLLLLLVVVFNRYKIKRDSNKILEEKNHIISKEKERSEELLLNILPDEVAEELKTNGEIESKIIENVTVLFTDFKGFTTLTKKLTPKELVSDLHECFSAFDRICEKYGIEKIKTIGDAYMAVGGLPTKNETHAGDAVKAALEIVSFIQQVLEKKRAEGRPYFEIRVGLHTGPVVAGIVGLKKFQYDIWGDTVNIANRMETYGVEGKVNISEKTYELVKNDPGLTFESRGKIEVKGNREITMWFVQRKESAEAEKS